MLAEFERAGYQVRVEWPVFVTAPGLLAHGDPQGYEISVARERRPESKPTTDRSGGVWAAPHACTMRGSLRPVGTFRHRIPDPEGQLALLVDDAIDLAEEAALAGRFDEERQRDFAERMQRMPPRR